MFDPLGKITVYEYGAGGMSKGTPPSARLRFSGGREAEGFTFNSKDKVLSITLALVPGENGGFAYTFTGTRRMDAAAILEYFAPLREWLAQENKGQVCGW